MKIDSSIFASSLWIAKIEELEKNPSFVNNILRIDEFTFSTGFVNSQNTHYWSLQNPHFMWLNKYKVQWFVNVWCSIWRGMSVRPFFVDVIWTGKKYVNLLCWLLLLPDCHAASFMSLLIVSVSWIYVCIISFHIKLFLS